MLTGLDATKLIHLLERLVVACERIADQQPRPEEVTADDTDSANPEWLSPKQVAELLGCCYGEARQRMLDGRIRAVKDGRWVRSRREWIDEYLQNHTVQPPRGDPAPSSPAPRRRKRADPVRAGGIAAEFIRERQG